jgi:hypothetical protein
MRGIELFRIGCNAEEAINQKCLKRNIEKRNEIEVGRRETGESWGENYRDGATWREIPEIEMRKDDFGERGGRD